jgi:hypothetical protein
MQDLVEASLLRISSGIWTASGVFSVKVPQGPLNYSRLDDSVSVSAVALWTINLRPEVE